MSHILGVSGSVILTNPNQFDELFQYNLPHIEIGEFPDHESFLLFLQLLKGSNISFGLHSPLYRNQSKYDLLERVHFHPELAWKQFEEEVAIMSRLGAQYVLVHFPYFKEAIDDVDAYQMIETGLERLAHLQQKYEMPIVCKPKLGLHRSRVGIQHLHRFPIEKWAHYGLYICIDIGDYLLAGGANAHHYIEKWIDYIKVVHLHNVEFREDQYIWIPVHPSHENDGVHYSIRELMMVLAQCKDVFFVLEQTPHTNPTMKYVSDGIQWIRGYVHEEV